MKNYKLKAIVLLAFLLAAYFFLVNYVLKIADATSVSKTELIMKNVSNKDSVLTYITLGNNEDFVTDVHGIFGIKEHGLQGSFYMHKDTVYKYSYDKKGFSGNISFGTVPLNCPTKDWKTGVSLYEVTINNYGTVSKAQETCDISCVDGVNALGKIIFSDTTWIAGGKRVDSAYNFSLNHNFGQVGVYPYRCDLCTAIGNPPKCTTLLPPSKPQAEHTCNMSRDAAKSGGTVTVEFEGYTH